MKSRGAISLGTIAVVTTSAVVLAVVGILLVVLLKPEWLPWADDDTPSVARVELPHRYVNRRVGYEIRYPDGWRLTRQGTVVRVISGDRNAVISVGRGPRGGLLQASTRLLDTVEEVHNDVRVTASRVQRMRGSPAFVITGTAVNPRGTRFRFLNVLIQGRGRNYAMTVFTTLRANRERLQAPVQEILNSFRILPAA